MYTCMYVHVHVQYIVDRHVHVHVYIQCMMCALCEGVWLSLPSEEKVKKIDSLRKTNRESERERRAVSECL